MDLRIKKTKRAIRSAFYELIKEKPLEKITVREIAERAEINKTTFYAHYETVYDLVDQLEQEAVAEVISQLNTAQGLLSSPRAFVKEIYTLLSKNQLCTELFSAPAMAQFTAHLRNAILEKVKQDGIDSTQYENIGAVLVFIFNGIAGLQASAPGAGRSTAGHDCDFCRRRRQGPDKCVSFPNYYLKTRNVFSHA